jgi:hypothetical protein
MAAVTSVVLYNPRDASPEVRTIAWFLAGYSRRTREAYTLDLQSRRVWAWPVRTFWSARASDQVADLVCIRASARHAAVLGALELRMAPKWPRASGKLTQRFNHLGGRDLTAVTSS